MDELVGEAVDAGVGFDDLTRDFIAEFVALDRDAALFGAGELFARAVEKSAGTDAPVEANAVVGAVVKLARPVVVLSAAESAVEDFGAQRRDDGCPFRALAARDCCGELLGVHRHLGSALDCGRREL